MRKAKSVAQIRREAQRVLDQLKIKRPPVPVEKIAAALGAKIKYAPYEGEIAGMLARGNGEVVIGVNSLHHPNRQRFTIAHELGHLLLHNEDVHIDRALRQWNVAHAQDDESLAIDGKTMCNAIDADGYRTHILSAIGHQSKNCYTQKK